MRFLILLLALVAGGCETTKLWKGDPIAQYVKVVPESPDQDVEEVLKQSGREYQCEELGGSDYPGHKTCYAKVAAEEHMEIKLLKTPETLVTDAGSTIKIVAYVLLKAAEYSVFFY